MDIGGIDQLVVDGTIRATRHPQCPLTIYNYTVACQFENRWSELSLACRGLIVTDDGEIVARPFPKFFNLDQHTGSETALSRTFTVTEKMDGSLGILYPSHDGWAIATRGCFDSEQALWATSYLRRFYPDFVPQNDVTYLFEIIYPDNRVVVDYEGREDLILLATIDTASGRDLDESAGWPGPVVQRFTISDTVSNPNEVIRALGLTDDENFEGVVLRFDYPEAGPHFRVKIKLEEYKRLHKLLTATSTKTVWEALSSGSNLSELIERVPDEFYDWLTETVRAFEEQYAVIDAQARSEMVRVLEEIGPGADRRTFAECAKKSKFTAMLFKLLDEQPIDNIIWKQLKPEYARPFRAQSESVA